MYDIDIVFNDGTTERIRCSEWDLTRSEGQTALKVQIGRDSWRYFPLSSIKWWDSVRR